MARRAVLLVGLLAALAPPAAGQVVVRGKPFRVPVPVEPAPPVGPAVSDPKALEAAGLKPDDPAGLVGYLRLRTLSDADLSRIQSVIKRLGADDFDDRLKAAAEAERFGPAAVGPLRAAGQSDPDPEVAYRAAECLRRMEKVPHAAVARAAVRALARLKPPDAAGAMLAFLPLADDDAVAGDIRAALVALAVRDGAAEPALVAALADPLPARRAAAGVALILGGPADKRVRIPDAYPKVRAAAKAEADPETKFQLLHALLTVAREKEAVGAVIDLIPDMPRGRLWQAEDYLLQLAGDAAPKVVFGKSAESLAKGRDAWKAWWAGAAEKTDLGAFTYTPRIAGNTVLVLLDFRFGTVGAVAELGPDLKERWRINGLQSPMDAAFLPDGTVAIAEHNGNRVTIRDTTGRELSTRVFGPPSSRPHANPQQVQVLENGNLFVASRNVLVEFKADKDEEVMRYVRQYDMAAAYRLPDGATVALLQNGPNHCLFLDPKGKEIPNRTLTVGMPFYQAHVSPAGKDRLLVTEQTRVAEYDLKANKLVWSKDVNQPRCAQRLPNGNTLVVDAGANQVVEVSPGGEVVWTYSPPNGLNVFRAYRR